MIRPRVKHRHDHPHREKERGELLHHGVLPIMTAIGAATLVGVVGTGWLFMAINVSDSEAVEVAGVCFGFWMLGGFSLAGVVRKLQRIMRDANAE